MNTVMSSDVKCGVALGLAGLHAGAMAFMSFVEMPTLSAVAEKKNASLLRAFMPEWFPRGRDYMMPLMAASAAAAVVAYNAEVLLPHPRLKYM